MPPSSHVPRLLAGGPPEEPQTPRPSGASSPEHEPPRSGDRRAGLMLRLLQAQREVDDPRAMMLAAARAVAERLRVDRAGFLRVVETEDGDALDFDAGESWTNGTLPRLTGRFPLSLLGERVLSAMRQGLVAEITDLQAQPADPDSRLSDLGARAMLATPVLRAGRWVGSFYLHHATPRAWSLGDRSLAREVADQTWDGIERAEAVAELRGSRARLGAAMAVAQLGTFEWNVRTGAVSLDPRSREIFGFGTSPAEVVDREEQVFGRIHPADRGWVQALTRRAIERGERVDVEYRLALPDGRVRHIASSSTMIAGEDGRTERSFGVFSDITERKWDDVRNQVLVELADRLPELEPRGREADREGEREPVAGQEVEGAGPERLVDTASQVLGLALGITCVGAGVADPAQGTVVVSRAWQSPDGVAEATPRHLAIPQLHGLLASLATASMVAVPDVSRDPRTGAHAEALGRAGACSLVLLRLASAADDEDLEGAADAGGPVEDGPGIAVLVLAHDRPRRWPARELALVREVAARVREVEDRWRASRALSASAARQAFLVRLADALRALREPAAIQAEASRLLGEELQASRAFYCEYDEDAALATVRGDWHAPGLRPLAGTFPIGPLAGLNDRLRSGRLLRAADVRHPGDELPIGEAEAALLESADLRAMLVLPLSIDGRMKASLTVAQDRPRRWRAADEDLVRETAERTWSAVERAKAETALREADRRKDEFLATLAHELRNPLAPLRNGLQIARLTSRSDPTLQRTVDMMDRQLTHLVRLVDDLLDVGRISSGKLALRRRPIALSDVLASALESTRVAIESRHHELVVRSDADDVRVLGDYDRLAQVFMNLLSNAAKYTEPGGRILLRVRREEGQAVVSVQDTGIGIPPEDLGRVFELFSQVRSHQGRAEGGLGIGLSLVRSLVALHGGTVEAQSEGPGHGAVFTVRLPALPVERPEAAGTRRSTDVDFQRTEPPRHVLVVDDNLDAAGSLAALLEMRGHAVRVAHDGVEALEKVKEDMPDVVFLDLGMPRMGGIEAARALRALPGGQDVLLVALTGWGQDADLQRTRESGFDRHVVKPVDASTLLDLLSRPARRTGRPSSGTSTDASRAPPH